MHPPCDPPWLYERDGELYVPSPLTEGPWDPNAQFGGGPAALLATVVERTPSLVPMQIARITIDLMRPIPLSPLSVTSRIVREGKKIQVVEASIFDRDIEVVRAASVRLRIQSLETPGLVTGEEDNPLPTEPLESDNDHFGVDPPGSRRAQEFLFEGKGGYFDDPEWVRLRVPLVAGEDTEPVARLAYVADLCSGLGARKGPRLRGINTDININVVRYPPGDWFCLTGTGWTSRTGIGTASATISDTSGLCATVTMARMVDPPD